MFDFQTEFILNDISGASIVAAVNDPSIPATEVALQIKKAGKFFEQASTGKIKTTQIFKRVGNAPVLEIAGIALSSIVLADLVGKVIRLSVDVRLSGSQDSEYSQWAVNKGQSYYAEFYVGQLYGSIALLLAAAAPVFNAGMAKGDGPQIVVTASTTNLVITATNEYQRILTSSNLSVIESSADDFPVLLGSVATTTPGNEGFATTWFLLKNLRLPTIENTRFMGETMDERPLANTIYNQFTLHVEAERAITGQGMVGQKGVSKTSHVFYIPSTSSAAFEALLAQIGTVETVA